MLIEMSQLLKSCKNTIIIAAIGIVMTGGYEMPVSDKLAYEIYIILLFHVVALMILFGFTVYIFLRAKKTSLIYSYLAVVAMIMLWMMSKIFKTVSPNESLRWFFIVTQYFAIQLLGYCLVVFAYIYTRNKVPSRKSMILWAVLPLVCFAVVLTNPLHMGFYSYFDFYKDRFGWLFFPTQCIQYAYLLTGILLLTRGYTHQPGFQEKKTWAWLFAAVTLLPLIANVYYILFKITDVPWIFPFPVFDFTPIAGSVALILFLVPALRYRFFDISPISYGRLFAQMSQGIVFIDTKKALYSCNSAFDAMFHNAYGARTLYDFAYALPFEMSEERQDFLDFIEANSSVESFEIRLESGCDYKVTIKPVKNKHLLLCYTDITSVAAAGRELAQKNAQLAQINQKLDTLAQNTREFAIAKTKANIAQNMHDILGHSLTVVIGTAELASIDTDKDAMNQKLSQIRELLASSLNDLKNTFIGKETDWGQTSLTKAISHLSNQNIEVDFVSQGNAYELNSTQTEAIFRLCQEAITNAIRHGKAKTIHLILRYKAEEVEVFALDNGVGCRHIEKSFGLSGIETRFNAPGGKVHFGSDGEHGFTIHATLPKSQPV